MRPYNWADEPQPSRFWTDTLVAAAWAAHVGCVVLATETHRRAMGWHTGLLAVAAAGLAVLALSVASSDRTPRNPSLRAAAHRFGAGVVILASALLIGATA